MADSAQVEEIIEYWNALMDKVKHSTWSKGLRARYSRPKDRDAVERYITWCEEREVDARAFLRARVEGSMRHRGHALKLNSIPSDKFLELKGGQLAFARASRKESGAKLLAEAGSHTESRVRELLVEPLAAQEHYRGRRVMSQETHLCITAPDDNGDGYDPRSAWCTQCPHNLPCAAGQYEREGFDVVALRMGRYDALPRHVREAVK